MMTLVDTSVWIEFFKPRPVVDLNPLELLIEERNVVTCRPVKAEVLSGEMSVSTREVITGALESMIPVDPDWNAPATWKNIVALAAKARQKEIGVPGLVDRMILMAALESGATLWTLDKKLKRFALIFGVTLMI